MGVQELNAAWVKSGQALSDLQNKANLLVQDEDATAEDIKDIQDKIANATAKRDLAYDNYVNAKADEVAALDNKDTTPLNENEKGMKAKFVDNFKGMIKNDPKIVNMLTSDTDEDGNRVGLTIPEDIQTAIHSLIRQYASLEQYVTVESVTTVTGSRVYEKWSDVTPLANLDDESAEIGDNDDPKLTLIKYAIKRYAGISTVTNSLLKDTAENILAWLSQWIAKKVVVTRNQAIIEQMNAVPAKPTLAKFDDIKDMAIGSVDPAIRATSFFMTNTSGIKTLSKVKDGMGNYLLQRDPTQPERYLIEGKSVVEISDRWLPNNKDVMPLYFGDLKQAVTLFDRENMSLLSTDIGGGAFERDLTKVRVIDRFDVEATDTEAFVAGSFKAIADQPANLGGSSASSTDGE